jgi:hypothetical protein
MPFPRLTWGGLLIVTLGWALLLSYTLLAPLTVGAAPGGELRDPARFLLLLGENAIITGFGVALLGALAALEKGLSLPARPASGASPPRPAAAAARPSQPPLTLQRQQSEEIVTKGAMAGRDYVLFRDGSVLVETLLGPRRFPTLSDAQQFIGAN